MRVLVDTSVWSLALRRRLGAAGLSGEETRAVAALTEAIKDGRAAIIGPVRQEVLSGVKHEAQFEKLSGALAAFPDAPIESRITYWPPGWTIFAAPQACNAARWICC